MCRMAAGLASRTRLPLHTPTIATGYNRDFTLQTLAAQLQQKVGDALKLSLGCDFHLSYDKVQDVLANPARYAIDGTHYMLVELSNYSVPQQTTDCFTQLGDRGITAIITHPERSPILRESPLASWSGRMQGCVIQD